MTKLTALLITPVSLVLAVAFAHAFAWVYTNAPGGLTIGAFVLCATAAVLTALSVALSAAGLHTLTH